jgi:catechol 2,3-dioxygenase-like lactoylglutathione lyase family enzyme
VPEITGRTIVILTVSDVARSATWYGELLGMEERGRDVSQDGRVEQILLLEPRTGLPSYTANAMITLRDPDNIQLEFFVGYRPLGHPSTALSRPDDLRIRRGLSPL